MTILSIFLFPLLWQLSFSASWLPTSFHFPEQHWNTQVLWIFDSSFTEWAYVHWLQMWIANKQLSACSTPCNSCNSSESSLTMSPSPYPLAYSAGSVPCTRLVLGCCQPSWWDLIAGMQLSASNYAGIVNLAASTPTVWVTLLLFAKRREDPSWALRNTILRLRSVKITFPI